MLGWLSLLAWTVGLYNLQDVSTTHPAPDIARVEYRIAAGTNPLNQFSITHVQSKRGCSMLKPPVVLLSPFMLPGSFYEITETNSYLGSAAGKLAMDGYDVWLVDQRRTKLTPGTCEQGAADCSVMADWDFDAFSSDGLLAVTMAQALHPTMKPVIGGFSAGANAALAVVNRAPHDIAGAFLYEGTFHTTDSVIAAHNLPICGQLETMLDAGTVYDPSAQMYGAVLGLAAADPSGISPIPAFPPGTTNQQALLYVFSAPPPAGALSPTPGFIRCLADFSTQQFLYTNPARLFQAGPKFDNYAPLAAMRDLACGLAGLDDHHYDKVGAFHGDLLVFVEGTGFGQALFDTAALFEHAKNITIEHHPEWGEADPYFHVSWQTAFYAPLKQWLDNVKF
jgi:pimeloyl-ACP methyl ester carboxylesterase